MQIFDLFNVKQKGVIAFSDFVRALNVTDGTGFIESQEVKKMLIGLLCESQLKLADDTIEIVLDKVSLLL
ncbi:EF-hand-like domain-containing protein [Cynara cardunculus var. scolymus]|uniref:Calcineurin B-like protein n=1 Tax=Cynara cardunculus var. scolymus TaxID=59895 RepID=A0A103XIM5_CYNCS|nr:EF-hand-like domain-containing protein [Cynara cardunculus var. scolymus]